MVEVELLTLTAGFDLFFAMVVHVAEWHFFGLSQWEKDWIQQSPWTTKMLRSTSARSGIPAGLAQLPLRAGRALRPLRCTPLRRHRCGCCCCGCCCCCCCCCGCLRCYPMHRLRYSCRQHHGRRVEHHALPQKRCGGVGVGCQRGRLALVSARAAALLPPLADLRHRDPNPRCCLCYPGHPQRRCPWKRRFRGS